jgi:D-alanyl-D-alanine carboxypeptidase/D-alanyl-D-alanine-endopeptidase (penicillin-binding protein 4)
MRLPSKAGILLGLACLSASCHAAPKPALSPPSTHDTSPLAGLRRHLDGILSRSTLAANSWGIVVKPIEGDEPWYSVNAGKLMMPASTMKIVTLAAAAETLGWDFRYETRLAATGPIETGTLNGDLLVVGSGDPSIDDWDGSGTRLFQSWAEQLKALGIRTITGRIVGDDNAFDDETLGFGWSWDDLAAGFAAGVSALQFNESSAQVTIVPGPTVGAPATATIWPPGSDLVLRSSVTTTESSLPPAIQRKRMPGSVQLELRGSIPLGGASSQIVSVENPTLFFVTALRRVLVEDGIEIRGAAADIDDLDPLAGTRTTLVTHLSPPLSDLATTLMRLSQNQFAETLLKTVGASSGTPTARGGRAVVGRILQDWQVGDGLIQVDGSGLSRYNYVTAETLVAVLSHIDRDQRLRERFEATLPIAGRDGTAEARMKGTPAEGNARVKTGSMAAVQAAAGYVTTADGEKLAFAIMANNFSAASPITQAVDAIIVNLAEFKR